jgi:PAS domain S-box-containing protein
LRPRFPAVAAAYVLVYVALGWALAGYPSVHRAFGLIAILIPPVFTVATIARRRREWRGCQRLFWDVMGIGLCLWMVGHFGWAYGEIVLEQPSWLQWHTLFSLVGGTGALLALIARPHRGVRPEAVSRTALDVASYALFALFFYSYVVMIPAVLPSEPGANVTLMLVAQGFRFVLLVATFATWFASRGTPWAPTFAKLALGINIGFFLRFYTSLGILSGNYQSGTTRDLAWIVPFLFYAWAALEAPRSVPSEQRIELPAPHPPAFLSAIPVLAIPLIGYGWLQIASVGPAGDSFRALVTSLTTVMGLGLLTLRIAAQRDELRSADTKLKLLAAATEHTADHILITDVDGRIAHANEAFVRALGYARQELAALHFTDLSDRGFEQLGRHISREVRLNGIWRGTILRKKKNGETFPVSCTVASLRDSSGALTHYVGAERDITEELKLRDQLVHTERLSAAGELVAGVAHEINNPLQTIVGCTELMLDEHHEPQLRRDLELVKQEAARAGQIVRNLLSFIRRSSPDRVVVDLNQIVRAIVELREYQLAQRNIAVRYLPAADPLPVHVNREEIQQIILNLVRNAEQAIESATGSGTITLRTMTSGRLHAVEVADDGPGVKSDLKGKIFEPFFTTKPVGEGTGLGLSISHGIASAHGGALELSATTGAGACFTLTLPAFVGHPANAATADSVGVR